ncbi:MAG: hypothetical protein AAGA60_03835 [Cyanobacteria bacterium P01_E01_bin.42]
MKEKLLGLLALLSTTLTLPAFAVEPALVDYRDRVSWSEVEYSEFDGLYVNDRHTGIGGRRDYFVSQWSKSGIRLTVRDSFVASVSIVSRVRYRSRRKYNHHRERWETVSIPRTVRERVENWSYNDYTPSAIHFIIDGDRYTYTEGEVSPELANALANAPIENMTIRLEFAETNQRDIKPLMEVEIGKGTVRAWRQVFAETSDRAEIQSIIDRDKDRDRPSIEPRENRR